MYVTRTRGYVSEHEPNDVARDAVIVFGQETSLYRTLVQSPVRYSSRFQTVFLSNWFFFYNVKFHSKGYGLYIDCSRSDRFAIHSINIRNHVRRPSSFVNEFFKERARIARIEEIKVKYYKRRLKN